LRLNTAIFILAGGRSSRMGTDKAFLRLGDKTLLERAMSTAQTVSGTITLVGDRARLNGCGEVVEDTFSGQGPLAGIHAGLASGKAEELNLFLAVDTPAIPSGFLKILLTQAASTAAVVTVPRVGGRFQTLCSVYRREFVALAESALKARKNKIDALFPSTSVRIIEENEIKELGFTADIFDNVNTPEDWQRMQQRFGTNPK
jgi:molybdopterin-guanine dinucleotide biosynthesis protein A